MKTKDLIRKLTAVPAVSGREVNIYDLLKDLLADFGEVKTDAMNNISCTFGEGGYHIILEAHLDEIGFVVTSVSEDGFLKISNCGGIDNRLLLGSEVTIVGNKEISGIISTLPPHLQQGSEEKKVPETGKISIDIGYGREEAEKLVSPGDRVVFRRHFDELGENRISANCLDDRAGVAAVLLALEKIKGLPIKVTALFSSQEELGTRGAKTGPYNINADEAIAVDVSFGYTPDCSREECGELGKGAMIGVSPVLDGQISAALADCAGRKAIRHQIEVMSGRTGTDADVISVCKDGIRCGLLSIPLKYMHTPVEVVDISDVESVADLLAEYIKEKAGVLNA